MVEGHEDFALDSASVGDEVSVVNALEDEELLFTASDSAFTDHLEHVSRLEPVVGIQLHHVEEESALALRALCKEVVDICYAHGLGSLRGRRDMAEDKVGEVVAKCCGVLDQTVNIVLRNRFGEDAELEVLLVRKLGCKVC